MYGSDYQGWAPGQFLDELAMEGFKPGVIDKLFYKSAINRVKIAEAAGKAW